MANYVEAKIMATENQAKGDLTKGQMLKIARNLQAGFTKDTVGSPKSWTEVTKAEQEAWIRTARRAARLLHEVQAS